MARAHTEPNRNHLYAVVGQNSSELVVTSLSVNCASKRFPSTSSSRWIADSVSWCCATDVWKTAILFRFGEVRYRYGTARYNVDSTRHTDTFRLESAGAYFIKHLQIANCNLLLAICNCKSFMALDAHVHRHLKSVLRSRSTTTRRKPRSTDVCCIVITQLQSMYETISAKYS
jgi:hypothetical protein